MKAFTTALIIGAVGLIILHGFVFTPSKAEQTEQNTTQVIKLEEPKKPSYPDGSKYRIDHLVYDHFILDRYEHHFKRDRQLDTYYSKIEVQQYGNGFRFQDASNDKWVIISGGVITVKEL